MSHTHADGSAHFENGQSVAFVTTRLGDDLVRWGDLRRALPLKDDDQVPLQAVDSLGFATVEDRRPFVEVVRITIAGDG